MLRKLLIALVLMLSLTRSASLRAQEPVPILAPVSLEMADVIRILAEYTVEHETSGTFCQQFYGMTNFNNKTIDLCDRNDSSQKRETLLHELFHIRYHEFGLDTGGVYESQIDDMAKLKFQQLFGLGPASPAHLPNLIPSVP